MLIKTTTASFVALSICLVTAGAAIAAETNSSNQPLSDEAKTSNIYKTTAQQCMAGKHYTEAIENLDKGIRANPSDASLHAMRSQANLKNGNAAQALVDANTAVKVGPSAPEGYKARGELYETMKKTAEALDDYSKAIKFSTSFDRDLINKHYNAATAMKRPDLAIQDCNALLNETPNDPTITLIRAQLYDAVKKLPQAVEDYELVFYLNPTQRAVSAALIRDLDQLAFSNPAKYVLKRAKIYEKMGRYDKAAADYTRVQQLNPKENYREQIAYLSSKAKTMKRPDAQDDIAECDAMLASKPDSVPYRLKRAVLYQKANQLDKAKLDYDYLIARGQPFYSERAHCLGRLGKYKEAVEDMDRAINLSRKSTGPDYQYRGWLYQQMGEVQKAKWDYDRGRGAESRMHVPSAAN